jgi:hypothetical protein
MELFCFIRGWFKAKADSQNPVVEKEDETMKFSQCLV